MSGSIFEKVSERTIFRDKSLGLREDLLRTREGRFIQRKVVEYRKAAAVIPVDMAGNVLLIRHYRHPINREIWEIPGGIIEGGETPADAASRELLEETGYRAAELAWLLEYHPEPAFSDHTISLFRANGLTRTNMPAEAEITDLWFAPPDALDSLVRSGQISSSWTLIALFTLLNHDKGASDTIGR